MSTSKPNRNQSGSSKKTAHSSNKKPVTKEPLPARQAVKQKSKPAAEKSSKKIWDNYLFQKIFLFAVSFLVYANTIKNGFNLDDEFYTNNGNKLMYQGLKAIPEIFKTHTFHDTESSYGYRPLTLLSFILQHTFLGTGPAVGHFINVVLYALTILFVFQLLVLWFGKERRWLAFFVTLLFALHPLHTEIVASIKSRDELLSMLFAMLSLIYAFKWYTTKKTVYIFLYPMLFLLAILSKITIITFAVAVPMAYYFFTDLKLKKIILYSLPVLIPMLFFAMMQRVLLAHPKRTLLLQENPLSALHYNFWQKIPTALYVMLRYLYLHIIPHPLVFYYGYKYVPIVSWNNVWVWVSLIIYLALGVYIIKTIRNKSILTFGLLFFVINMIAYSNLFQEGPGLIAERFAYAASLGFCIVVCVLLYQLFKASSSSVSFTESKRYLVYLILGIGFVYGIRDVVRNQDWKDKYTLYTHDMQYLHNSAKANMLMSEIMLKMGREYMGRAAAITGRGNMEYAANEQRMLVDSAHYFFNLAVQNLQQALTIFPDYSKAINNLGIAYFQEDSLLQAKHYIDLAWKADSQNAGIAYNLGILHNRLNNPDSAFYLLNQAIRLDSTYILAYNDLVKMYLQRKDTAAAVNLISAEARAIKNSSTPYAQLAGMSLMQGDTLKTVAYCEQAAKYPPPNNMVFSFLAKYYASHGNMEKANYYHNMMVQPN